VSFLKRHGAFLALLALAVPLTVGFCWQDVVATLGDDSVSYLTLARYFSPFSSDATVAPWAKYHGHFPPLFPMLLVMAGGTHSFLAAHLAVGACALAALVLVYRFAAVRLASARAGFLVALLFLLMPSAWINAHGILSEPLYLALTLAALLYHARRVEPVAGTASLLAFGALLGAIYLTRVAGVALIVAYAIHVAVRAAARRKFPERSALAPLLIPVVLAAVWLALRPEPNVDNYRLTLRLVLDRWMTDPAILRASWDALAGGWVASFTGDSQVGPVAQALFGALGVLGMAGALLGASRNRLDAWYVLASLAMIFLWVFPEAITRRLLYPLLPLLLIHAAQALAGACALLKGARYAGRALAAAWALLALLILPASILVAQKAIARAPLFADSGYSYAGITDYYTTVNLPRARAIAGEHAAVLAGLESIARTTPPDARVMWMRPEYVAVLGKRAAVPWYLTWDRVTLAREIQRTGAGYLVAARLYKNDLAGHGGEAFTPIVEAPPAYLRATLTIANPADGTLEFVLLEVDRAALDRYLAAAR
jgi:4-amino-4-deoxy-L-arabinose transferase-like glycosyltransferase